VCVLIAQRLAVCCPQLCEERVLRPLAAPLLAVRSSSDARCSRSNAKQSYVYDTYLEAPLPNSTGPAAAVPGQEEEVVWVKDKDLIASGRHVLAAVEMLLLLLTICPKHRALLDSLHMLRVDTVMLYLYAELSRKCRESSEAERVRGSFPKKQCAVDAVLFTRVEDFCLELLKFQGTGALDLLSEVFVLDAWGLSSALGELAATAPANCLFSGALLESFDGEDNLLSRSSDMRSTPVACYFHVNALGLAEVRCLNEHSALQRKSKGRDQTHLVAPSDIVRSTSTAINSHLSNASRGDRDGDGDGDANNNTDVGDNADEWERTLAAARALQLAGRDRAEAVAARAAGYMALATKLEEHWTSRRVFLDNQKKVLSSSAGPSSSVPVSTSATAPTAPAPAPAPGSTNAPVAGSTTTASTSTTTNSSGAKPPPTATAAFPSSSSSSSSSASKGRSAPTESACDAPTTSTSTSPSSSSTKPTGATTTFRNPKPSPMATATDPSVALRGYEYITSELFLVCLQGFLQILESTSTSTAAALDENSFVISQETQQTEEVPCNVRVVYGLFMTHMQAHLPVSVLFRSGEAPF
jgi:hypothetical protein